MWHEAAFTGRKASGVCINTGRNKYKLCEFLDFRSRLYEPSLLLRRDSASHNTKTENSSKIQLGLVGAFWKSDNTGGIFFSSLD